MMPQRFLLLGRAFNETVFLGLDRGPWFYSPTYIYIYIYIYENFVFSFKLLGKINNLNFYIFYGEKPIKKLNEKMNFLLEK